MSGRMTARSEQRQCQHAPGWIAAGLLSVLGGLLACASAGALDGYVLVTTGDEFQKGQLGIINCSTGQRTILDSSGDCFGPCFSPDGKRIAYSKSGRIWTINNNGSSPFEVGSCDTNKEPAMNWADNNYIYWTEQGSAFYRIPANGGSRETVRTFPGNIYMGSVSRDGNHAAATKGTNWTAYRFDLSNGQELNLGGGCQATVSPDGNLVTHNIMPHVECLIQRFSDGSEYTRVTAPVTTFNMHRFSHSSNDHIVFSRDDMSPPDAYVCHIHSNTSYNVGKGAPWDYWPGALPSSDQTVSISSFTVDNATINQGDTTTLRWSTANATRVYIEPSIGDVGGSGSQAIQPSQSTTYTLTAEGSGGPVTRQVSVTVSTPPPPPGPGTGILKEVWTNIGSGTAVSDLVANPGYPNNPSSSETASSFDGQIDWADNYGTRLRGYVIAPVTGQYVFMLSSDDASVLYLSSDQNPANAGEIARVDDWCPPDDWSTASGGVSLAQGQRYYVEALHKEGGGGDHIRVGWQMPGGAVEAPIPGHRLDPFVPTPPPDPVTIDSFNANPATIDYGATSMLSWTTSNATLVTLEGQAANANGSATVSPTSTTTYTLVAQGTDGPVSREATVTVNPPPPENVRIDQFTADPAAVDEGGSSTLSWATANASAVALDGQGVDASGSTQVWPSSTTTYTLTAEGTGGPVSQQVTVTVNNAPPPPPPPALPLAVNCGTASSGVAGWEAATPYVTGGADFTFSTVPDTSGVADAAPAEVYRTCRHQDHSYSFDVPDGEYTVRIHFHDEYAASDRQMDYTIEGVKVLDDFTIGAGAVVKEFQVTVADGNGLQIVAEKDAGNDVFESGIEIMEAGSPPPPEEPSITITSPVGGDVWYVGTTRRIEWTATNLDQVVIDVTTDGSQWVLVAYVRSDEPGWGSLSWVLPATPSAACQIAMSGYMGEAPTQSGVFEIREVLDSDGDGMDDDWEMLTFGDLSHDATTDEDGDGLTDYEEFVAGTDPLVASEGTDMGLGFGCLPGAGSLTTAARSGRRQCPDAAVLAFVLGLLGLSAAVRRRKARACTSENLTR